MVYFRSCFFITTNGEAQKLINKVYYKFDKIKFIDLSADFRIRNLNEYKQNYNIKHKASDLIKDSVYSISEFVGKKLKILELLLIQDVTLPQYNYH